MRCSVEKIRMNQIFTFCTSLLYLVNPPQVFPSFADTLDVCQGRQVRSMDGSCRLGVHHMGLAASHFLTSNCFTYCQSIFHPNASSQPESARFLFSGEFLFWLSGFRLLGDVLSRFPGSYIDKTDGMPRGFEWAAYEGRRFEFCLSYA